LSRTAILLFKTRNPYHAVMQILDLQVETLECCIFFLHKTQTTTFPKNKTQLFALHINEWKMSWDPFSQP